MSTRDAAVAAARRGWHVFPARPGGKEPRAGLSWPAAATADPARVAAAHWRPGENYGIAAKQSGLIILDLDRLKPGREVPPRWRDEPGIADGADVLAVLAERAGVTAWPCTFTVATPSGGLHLYYQAPAGRRIGNRPLGPMIDVRGGGDGHGGYVIGPGSVIGGRLYRVIDGQDPAPLPCWVADLLDPPRRPPAVVGVSYGLDGRVAARFDGLIAAVLGARPGGRNNVLHWAACRAAEMASAGQVTAEQMYAALGAAAAIAGLPEREAERTIASGLRGAPGMIA